MTASLLPLRADVHARHPLHDAERAWTETNCYVDLWIEVLHALDLDPLAAAAFVVSTDFEGDQWTFFKYPPEDLRALYGIEVAEMNIWKPVLEHVLEQLDLGRLLTVEADSWYLPDTAGVSYRITHGKSTIVPQSVDVAGRRLGYFHNAGYYEMVGEDFDGVFRSDTDSLPPYVEMIKLDRLADVSSEDLFVRAVGVLRSHLSRLPVDNPMPRMRRRIEADMPWLRASGPDAFHLYAFGTCRQCGASAELAAGFCNWLAERDPDNMAALEQTAAAYCTIANHCKTLQFTLARAARGRSADLAPLFDDMAQSWATATQTLVAIYGGASGRADGG